MDELHYTLESGQVVLIFTREAVLVPEMLHELDVGAQVLQDLSLLNLKECVNTRGEEHICAIRLPVETGLLQHY